MEAIYHVYWEGPYKIDELEKISHNKHVLYQVYGQQPMYGTDCLLYIGMTDASVSSRFKSHEVWTENQADEVKIYVATIGEFKNWEYNNKLKLYQKPNNSLIRDIEKLLIYSHMPSYNTQCKKTDNIPNAIRIFNTGRRKSLFPEISSTYYK